MFEEEEQEQPEEFDDASRGVSSSMVAAIGYDRPNSLLLVDFANGHSEAYPVSAEQWDEVRSAVSIGKWLWENVL